MLLYGVGLFCVIQNNWPYFGLEDIADTVNSGSILIAKKRCFDVFFHYSHINKAFSKVLYT